MFLIAGASKDVALIASTLSAMFMELGYRPSGQVFVKPNLCGRAPILESENTTTYFMDGLLDVLNAHGCTTVIGHSSLLGTTDRVYSFDKVIHDAGFDKYRNRPSVGVLNLDDAPRRKVDGSHRSIELPEAMFEADSYINLAKLKTHMEAGVSLSMKNQMGLLSQSDRIRFHQGALDEPIAHLSELAVPTVSVLEAIVAMEGNGPHHGNDRSLNTVMMGTDVLELDCVAARYMGIDPQSVGHLKVAAEMRGVPTNRPTPVDALWNLKPASNTMRIGPRLSVYPTTSCSRCITALSEGGRSLRSSLSGAVQLGAASWLGGHKSILIGTPRGDEAPPGKVVCVGKCAARGYVGEAARLEKCAPTVAEVEEFLRSEL